MAQSRIMVPISPFISPVKPSCLDHGPGSHHDVMCTACN
jgi:hypothetical protein